MVRGMCAMFGRSSNAPSGNGIDGKYDPDGGRESQYSVSGVADEIDDKGDDVSDTVLSGLGKSWTGSSVGDTRDPLAVSCEDSKLSSVRNM